MGNIIIIFNINFPIILNGKTAKNCVKIRQIFAGNFIGTKRAKPEREVKMDKGAKKRTNRTSGPK